MVYCMDGTGQSLWVLRGGVVLWGIDCGEGSLEREEGGSVENYGRHFGVRFSNGRSSLVEKNKKFLHTGTHKHNIGLFVCVSVCVLIGFLFTD